MKRMHAEKLVALGATHGKDLVEHRISHARAAVEMRKLYERQKGGWLFAGLRAKKPQTAVAAKTPPPLPKTTPRTAFDRALTVQHDAKVSVVPKAERPSSLADAKTEVNPVEKSND